MKKPKQTLDRETLVKALRCCGMGRGCRDSEGKECPMLQEDKCMEMTFAEAAAMLEEDGKSK